MTRRTNLAGGVLAAGLVVVLVWFQPQALLINRTVEEGLPPEATSSSTPSDAPDSTEATENVKLTEAPDPQAVRQGSFTSRSRYTVKGSAEIYELAGGRRILRLKDFSSTNGPDLRVYLSPEGSNTDDDALAVRFVDLGPLKGNRGNQNYEVPNDLDLTQYASAVVWCRRFAVGFGAADLRP